MLLAGLAMAGLPPLGPGLGKAVAEEALGDPWMTALFHLTSALTGAAVVRAALRVYFGLGPRPEDGGRAVEEDDTGPTTTGAEDAETETPPARARTRAPASPSARGAAAVPLALEAEVLDRACSARSVTPPGPSRAG